MKTNELAIDRPPRPPIKVPGTENWTVQRVGDTTSIQFGREGAGRIVIPRLLTDEEIDTIRLATTVGRSVASLEEIDAALRDPALNDVRLSFYRISAPESWKKAVGFNG
jgi:hypothetical protein